MKAALTRIAAATTIACALAAPAGAEQVGEVGVDWIGNDIVVEAIHDPEVEGVTCHVSYFERGLIDRQDQATVAGLQVHRHVEDLTDDLCAAAISSLGERFAVVLDAVAPLADVAATQVPYPNPMGVPRREV